MPLFDQEYQKSTRKAKKAKPVQEDSSRSSFLPTSRAEDLQREEEHDSGNDYEDGQDEDAAVNPDLSHGSSGEEEEEKVEPATPKKSHIKSPAKKKKMKPSVFNNAMSEEKYNKQMMAQMHQQQQPQQQVAAPAQPKPEGEKKNPLKLRLDLNLDIEIELRAKIHGDITLALLDMG